MPNIYATPSEIKRAMPDGIQAGTTKYDALLLGLAERVSRFVDGFCRRVFYPSYGARYFSGPGGAQGGELWVDDLIEIDAIEISEDGGTTYTALAASDTIGTVAGDLNDARSYTMLALDVNGDYSSWPSGQRAVKISGWWGFTENRGECWDDSGLDLALAYTAGGAALTVADVSAMDRWGLETALHAGRLARVEDELFEVTGVTNNVAPVNDTASVIGARNGTAAANHDLGDGISLWRACEVIKQATIIQAVRQMERGFQGFGDARATPDLGQIMYVKALDPEVQAMLKSGRYIRNAVG